MVAKGKKGGKSIRKAYPALIDRGLLDSGQGDDVGREDRVMPGFYQAVEAGGFGYRLVNVRADGRDLDDLAVLPGA